MTSLIQLKQTTLLFLVALGLACFGFLPRVQAVVPPPDGCYPNFTTAEGCDALSLLTSGAGNTAIGWRSLFSNADGSFNTALGGGALALNNGDSNTAVGAAALLLNTSGTENTATGTDALVFNNTGTFNTADGAFDLFMNTTGASNTAVGSSVLSNNHIAARNTAVGSNALRSNDSTGNGLADDNTGVGVSALASNTDGFLNTAVGADSLNSSATGNDNTAIGWSALTDLNSGGDNTAIGWQAGANLNAGENGNIYIGSGAYGIAGENGVIRIGGNLSGSQACYIRGIAGVNIPGGATVYIDPVTGRLGDSNVSSARYKEDIKPMDKASESILALNPVTFHFKKKFDPKGTPQFGLVAEEVAKVNPDLVRLDRDGEPISVRYEAVNAMLLNEFLKEHRKVTEQEATIAQLKSDLRATAMRQQKEIEALTAELKKVSAELVAESPSRSGPELNRLARQVVKIP